MTKPLLFHYQHNNDDPSDDNKYTSAEYAFCVSKEGCDRMIANLEETDPEFEHDLQAWLDGSQAYEDHTYNMESQYGIHEVCHHSEHDEIFTTGFYGAEINPAGHVEFINHWREFFVSLAGEENVSPAMLVDSRDHYYDRTMGGHITKLFDSTSLNVYKVLQSKLVA